MYTLKIEVWHGLQRLTDNTLEISEDTKLVPLLTLVNSYEAVYSDCQVVAYIATPAGGVIHLT